MSATTNFYKENIDFAALGREDPDFGKFLKSNGQLDFSDPKSVQQLTKSLLKRDFHLDLTLPDDRLCPPIRGLDIGTGASCIYPLLGCAQRPLWRFTGTGLAP
ncbi:hypothetical protein SS1G_13816 [Sclerotinia sclerotiorum 1980 UF-70]|uniref:Uncharacterized protein n=1 Tax=Sclerotinia sclerotiorum (strain ATCC 18683 / 1980 / Ss-1) TaxID=665079 RepID=A7F885_SCLS1|nr:hypothetical protein SS1G_13816 [Sclerotinia sclerotiorum 1980 UF-70]EDN98956.1 hypothetical protein SS1G_13816 [Sclerotinia sclerotiorum 1980 UF-70]